MTRSRVIGRANAMPWHSSPDLRRFKALTWGHPIVMGKNTFTSLGKALPGRDNIVVSRSLDQAPGAQLARSWQQALELAHQCATERCYVIGGAQVYSQALARADKMELSIVEQDYSGDCYFPEWSESDWRLELEESLPDAEPPLRFLTYSRIVAR